MEYVIAIAIILVIGFILYTIFSKKDDNSIYVEPPAEDVNSVTITSEFEETPKDDVKPQIEENLNN